MDDDEQIDLEDALLAELDPAEAGSGHAVSYAEPSREETPAEREPAARDYRVDAFEAPEIEPYDDVQPVEFVSEGSFPQESPDTDSVAPATGAYTVSADEDNSSAALEDELIAMLGLLDPATGSSKASRASALAETSAPARDETAAASDTWLGGAGWKFQTTEPEKADLEAEEPAAFAETRDVEADGDDQPSFATPIIPFATVETPVVEDQPAGTFEESPVDDASADEAAIFDNFEAALHDDLAFSLEEELSATTDEPSADDAFADEEETFQEPETAKSDPAEFNVFDAIFAESLGETVAQASEEENLFEDEIPPHERAYETESDEAPILETAEMPSDDIEPMEPLDLPEFSQPEEPRSTHGDIERELDAAIAGFDQYDAGMADVRASAHSAEPAANAAHDAPVASTEGSFDLDTFDFAEDLNRDLEFVSHDLEVEQGVSAAGTDTMATEAEAESRSGRSNRGMMIAAVVGGVAILGIIGAFGLYSSDTIEDTGPVLVKADPDPVKVVPKDPGGKTVPNQDRAVYGEVDGIKAADPKQEALVSTSEEPMDLTGTLPPGISETGKSEARLQPDASTDPELLPAAGNGEPVLEPRRVRTVIVKPDGSFVSKPAGQQASATQPSSSDGVATRLIPAGSAQSGAGLTATADDAPAGTFDGAGSTGSDASTASADDAQSAPAGDTMAAVSDAPADSQQADSQQADMQQAGTTEEADATGLADATGETDVNSADGGTDATVPVRTAKTTTIRAPSSVPERPSGLPAADGAASRPTQVASAPQAAPQGQAATSEYSVQIASQPSAASAQQTATNLSRRYSDILSGRGITIQEANIEGRGTFHRVRVSASSRQDAIQLCERFKAAGGSCFVAK